MRGAARAVAWELVWRHRTAFIILAAYLAAFAAVKAWILGPEIRVRFDPPNNLAAFVSVPATIAFFYLVGVFTYGLSGDLAARESTFPKRMLTLPVKTAALAGWPMLYGTIASLILWLGTATFARWAGAGDALPLLWPALLLAAWLAWMQALTWMPYGLRGLRVLAAIAWLVAVDAIVLVAIYARASEATMVALLAPQIALAYFVAWFAVARARRGEVPDWSFAGTPAARTPAQEGFRSAVHAQAWFEWRRHGSTLPVLVGAVVPFELLLLFIPGNETTGIVFGILFLVMITPPLMAAFAAPALGSFTTFSATRPLTGTSLIAAKLRMAMASTFAAWMLAAIFTAVALVASGTMPVVTDKLAGFFEFAGALRGTAVVALAIAALVGSTWKILVQSLCIALTGNAWLIRSSVLFVFALMVVIGPLVHAFARSDAARLFAWDNLPWIVAGLVCAKLLAAAWVAVRLHESRVFSDAALVKGAAAWLAAVAALYAFLEWLAGAPVFPFYFVAAVAILAMPLARVSAAPLALASNRHR